MAKYQRFYHLEHEMPTGDEDITALQLPYILGYIDIPITNCEDKSSHKQVHQTQQQRKVHDQNQTNKNRSHRYITHSQHLLRKKQLNINDEPRNKRERKVSKQKINKGPYQAPNQQSNLHSNPTSKVHPEAQPSKLSNKQSSQEKELTPPQSSQERELTPHWAAILYSKWPRQCPLCPKSKTGRTRTFKTDTPFIEHITNDHVLARDFVINLQCEIDVQKESWTWVNPENMGKRRFDNCKRQFKCRQGCKNTSNNITSFLAHIQSRNCTDYEVSGLRKNKIYQCIKCPKQYPSISTFKTHLMKTHKIKITTNAVKQESGKQRHKYGPWKKEADAIRDIMKWSDSSDCIFT